ncbi:retinal pigment epithelial membrane protein [Naegleria gruberi]|uniref:Retinal pigment epithelial membrane protein n=1 Tax=Naegleria gruberi TaxID=5762 RepID=D2VKM5_NAEGR|nr:retinal pigment epithelial membrane protein [Naegleria gruberi]EFC42714.1 retinal pigment epithelial membrane protein [Naegleria gruberi]|eukprot:XP_002675458.1 retinal pigment epithelial membrane protein [Naegleria gruberi strain NEG-M]
MNGNFAPIHDELTITKLPIISGEIPKDLNGIYARIGPNPQFNPLYNLHWFEGDGHIHALEFKDGNCSYRNRFVQTEKYLQEKENGRPLAHSMIMDGGINPLLKYTYHYLYERMYRGLNGPLKKGGGAANTNIIYHGGKFLALEEGHKPMEVTFPDLKTVGEFDFKGKLKHNFTAHPKIDPRNGEMIFFGYELNPRGTSFRYGVTDKNLDIIHSHEFTKEETPYVCMIHDMVITENYSIVGFYPLILDVKKVLTGENPIVFDDTKPTKIAVFPRLYDGKSSKIQFFEAETGVAFHYINAYEEREGDDLLIKILVHVQKSFSMTDFSKGQPFPYEYTLNLTSGKLISEGFLKTLDGNQLPSGEFPVVRGEITGQKNRFFYYSLVVEKSELFVANSIAKVDLEKGNAFQTITIPNNGMIGEVSIIPRSEEEDDVYIVCYAYHEHSNSSTVFVFDGKTMNNTPLVNIELPRRVPFGFHGNFFETQKLLK